MTDRTKEILTFLDALANEYGLKFDKYHKQLVIDAIRIVSRLELEPPEEIKHFDIPAELDNKPGYIPSAEQPITPVPVQGVYAGGEPKDD